MKPIEQIMRTAPVIPVLVVDDATTQSASMSPGSGGDLARGHLDPLRPLNPPGPKATATLSKSAGFKLACLRICATTGISSVV